MPLKTISTAQEFARLRQSSDADEQMRATYASASVEVWQSVIDLYPDLKSWVVHNKAVPLDILRQLAGDTDARVRRAVARKRKLDRSLFEELATDDDESARNAVAMNAKCPEDIRNGLQAKFHGS